MQRTATRIRASPLPDERVPLFTLVPQAVATLAVVGDPQRARMAFLLAFGLDLPLYLAGRLDRRRPDLPSVRALVAGLWAVACGFLIPGLLEPDLRVAALAATWSSAVIGVVLHVVPGPWSRVGALFAAGPTHHVPRRHAAVYVARRLAPVSVAASLVCFVFAPAIAGGLALVGLAALVVWHGLETT